MQAMSRSNFTTISMAKSPVTNYERSIIRQWQSTVDILSQESQCNNICVKIKNNIRIQEINELLAGQLLLCNFTHLMFGQTLSTVTADIFTQITRTQNKCKILYN